MTTDLGKLEKYTGIIRTYYRETPATYEESVSNAWMPAILQERLQNKEHLFEPAWSSLIHLLQSMETVHRVKDLSFDSYNCCKVLLSMQESNLYGIGMYLSLTGNLMGFYYCSLDKQSPSPVKTVYGTDAMISYDPFYNGMTAFRESIESVTRQLFPNFEVFDNSFASYEVKNVQLLTGYHTSIDLFQAIFDTNLHSLI